MYAQLVTVQDHTTKGIDPEKFWNYAWALNYQARFHYGWSPWVLKSYAPKAEVFALPRGNKIPSSAWAVEFLDTSDVEGALGYHEDISQQSTAHSTRGLAAETELPLAKVFVKTAEADGVDPCEVASHEILEMLVDPYVIDESKVRKVLNKEKKEWYIVEVGDPVQGHGYDVGAPEGRATGVTVADFAWPRWFGMAQGRTALSFREAVKNPFEIAPQGYMSVAPESEPNNWKQIQGALAKPVASPDEPKA